MSSRIPDLRVLLAVSQERLLSRNATRDVEAVSKQEKCVSVDDVSGELLCGRTHEETRPESQPCEHRRCSLVGLAQCKTSNPPQMAAHDIKFMQDEAVLCDHRLVTDERCSREPHPVHMSLTSSSALPVTLRHDGRLTTAIDKTQPCFGLFKHKSRRPSLSPATHGDQAPRRLGAAAGGKLTSSMLLPRPSSPLPKGSTRSPHQPE